MGQLVPVFVAYLLLCFGVQYFREPKEVGPGPLVSSYIFMFAAFLLLWDIRLYPKSLRRLGFISQCFVEFLVASFLFENIMVDFWFPLEFVVLVSAAKLAELLEEMLQSAGNWSCEMVCEFLKNEKTSLASSYLLSTFFLLAVLHATRAIDLRELENGPSAFFRDIICRAKRYFRRQTRQLGMGAKKKVQIRDRKCNLSVTDSSSDICPGTSRRKCISNNKCNVKRSTKKKDPCDNELKYSFSDFEMALKDDER